MTRRDPVDRLDEIIDSTTVTAPVTAATAPWSPHFDEAPIQLNAIHYDPVSADDFVPAASPRNNSFD